MIHIACQLIYKIEKIFLILVFALFIWTMLDQSQIKEEAAPESRNRDQYMDASEYSAGGSPGGQVGRLRIDGTCIDYPVMQGPDNIIYLNHREDGTFSLNGSIFLDYRNNPDFEDRYSLVYGHHTENMYMFGSLEKFLNEEYFNEHDSGVLKTEDKKFEIDIFASLTADTSSPLLCKPDEITYEEAYASVREKAICFRDDSRKDKQQIIALSTCRGSETNERIMVFGYLYQKS